MLYSQDKKTLILEAADNLFHRFGYAKTSLDDIAKEAGMGKGTIYYHFESKEDIFFGVVEQYAERFEKLVRESVKAETDFVKKFTTLLTLPLKLAYKHAPLADALKNLPENSLQKLKEFRNEHRSCMIDILEEVINDGMAQGVLTNTIPAEKLVMIVFDWFLMGDANIVIQDPDAFIAKAEAEHEWFINLLLFGIMKRGETE